MYPTLATSRSSHFITNPGAFFYFRAPEKKRSTVAAIVGLACSAKGFAYALPSRYSMHHRAAYRCSVFVVVARHKACKFDRRRVGFSRRDVFAARGSRIGVFRPVGLANDAG